MSTIFYKLVATTLVCSSIVFSEKLDTERIWQQSQREAMISGNDVRLIAYQKYQQAFRNLEQMPIDQLEYINDSNGTNYCERYYNAVYNFQIGVIKADYQARVKEMSKMCELLSGKYGLTKVIRPTDTTLLAVYNKMQATTKERKKYIRPSGDKTALIAVSGAHGDEQSHLKIREVTTKACSENDNVVVVITGGVIPKIEKTQKERREKNKQTQTPVKEVLGQFGEHVLSLLDNPKVHVILNMGKYELMHASDLVEFYKTIRNSAAAKAGRFHIVSSENIPSEGTNPVKASVGVGDIDFVGYCTPNVQPEKRPRTRQKQPINADNNQNVNKPDSNVVSFVKNNHKNNRVFVLLAYGQSDILDKDVIQGIDPYLKDIPLTILFGGSDDGGGQQIKNFRVSKWLVPFGAGASIINILPYSVYPLCRKASWDSPQKTSDDPSDNSAEKQINIEVTPDIYHSRQHLFKKAVATKQKTI
jgi:hypothetical protein